VGYGLFYTNHPPPRLVPVCQQVDFSSIASRF
jgi:hypothetical protein